MKSSVRAAYRRLAPAFVRELSVLLKRARRGSLGRLWQQWSDQPLGEPLEARDLASRRRRYRLFRRLLTVRTWRRYGKDFDHKFRSDEQFRLASTAARFYETEPLRADHVMYESYNGRDFSGNPYALFTHLIDHPEYDHLHHVIAIEDRNNVNVRRYRAHPRVTIVELHSKEFIRFAESCKYFVNNASFKPYLIKRPGQVYFTTWHSTLLKKLAKDTGRPWEAANVSRALVASDIHLSPNAYTTEFLFKSHGVDGLVRGRVYEMGYPRNDLTINVDRTLTRERLGVHGDTKIAVYAPTWRGSYVPEDTAAQTLEYADQIRKALPDGYVLLVKFHTLVYRYVNESAVEGVVPRDVDTNELLGVTDLLITDYSGIFFDYLLTGNPVVYFTPDREAYTAAKQGFYLDLDALPGPLCDDLDTLTDALNRLPDIKAQYAGTYADFVERFVSHDDGKVCERAARLLFGEQEYEEYLSKAPGAAPDPAKRDLLFYPANLAGNGVTESFIALMDNLDHERFNAVVVLPSAVKYQDVQQRLHPQTKVFYQTVVDGYLRSEYIKERAMTDYGVATSADVPTAAFTRTMRRVFGDCSFDAVVNYNGYFPNAAAKLATGVSADRKLIYLHNDLEVDRTIKHPQLLSVFSIQQLYDRCVCVSADSLEDNIAGAARRAQYSLGIDLHPLMTYSRNAIMPDQIRARGASGTTAQIGDRKYLVFSPPGSPQVTGIQFDPAKQNLVCVGRLSPEKNHARLFKAFQRVAEIRDDVMLYVVGTGVLEDQLKSLAETHGLSEKIVFTGFLENPLPLVARASCFVLASDIEGQPITILEALVLGCPVIATDIAGPRGLLEDGYGALVPPAGAALADAILAQLSDTPPKHRRFEPDEYVEAALGDFYRLIS